MSIIEEACSVLDKNNINYELINHEVVHTMDDIKELGLFEKGEICKNLFICDDKGSVNFLVTLKGEKNADLQKLASQLGCKKLRFASESRLNKYLGLAPGAVSPLGILNDKTNSVIMVFDKDLLKVSKVGIHPNDNSATVILDFKDLKKLIETTKNPVEYIKI